MPDVMQLPDAMVDAEEWKDYTALWRDYSFRRGDLDALIRAGKVRVMMKGKDVYYSFEDMGRYMARYVEEQLGGIESKGRK